MARIPKGCNSGYGSYGLGKPHLEIEAECEDGPSRTAEFRPNCLNGPTSLTLDKAWTSPNGLAYFTKNWIPQQLNMATSGEKTRVAEHMCRMANVHSDIKAM